MVRYKLDHLMNKEKRIYSDSEEVVSDFDKHTLNTSMMNLLIQAHFNNPMYVDFGKDFMVNVSSQHCDKVNAQIKNLCSNIPCSS